MPGTPLKVCLISPFPPPYGGIAHWASMVVRYIDERRDVSIVALDTAPRWRAFHNTGIAIRVAGGALQLLRDIGRLVGKLSTGGLDVVHLTTSGQLSVVRDLICVHLARLFSISFVYHIRFGRVPEIACADSMEWRLMRHVMHRSGAVIAIDRETFSTICQYAPSVKIELIPNCIDLSRLPGESESVGQRQTRIAMFIGWVIPSKGVTELVSAWSKIKTTDWYLHIVGPCDDRYAAELRNQYPLANIKFVGELPHPQAMTRLADCDLFVLPSHTEGFPNVVVEAMALGKPVIATEVGAIPEMLADDAGILVAAKNREALTCALEKAIGDPGLRHRLGAKAKERAREIYALDVVAGAYVDTWRRVSRKV